MNHIRLQALAVFLCFVTVGCADEQQVAALQKKTDALQSEVKTLKESLSRLSDDQSVDKFVRDAKSIAYLTPGETGYSVIESDLGRLTVALDNVQPYANGTRITLRFGNLTSATINGAKATLDWAAWMRKVPQRTMKLGQEISVSLSLFGLAHGRWSPWYWMAYRRKSLGLCGSTI
jgi:hypothetical protein